MKYHFIASNPPTENEKYILLEMLNFNWFYTNNIHEADIIIIGDSVKGKICRITKDKNNMENFVNGRNFIGRTFFI